MLRYTTNIDIRFTAVPSIPIGPLTTSNVTSTSITISWNPPSSTGGIPVSAYVIERRDVRYSTWLMVEKVRPMIASYCIQNLLEGNEYLFRVFAENAEGFSEPLQITVPVLIQGVQGF